MDDCAADFGRLEMVLRRSGVPDRVPFFELYSNIEPQVLEHLGAELDAADPDMSPEERWEHDFRRHARYMSALGYDYVNAGARSFAFPKADEPTAMTAQGERAYVVANAHTIADRSDFERYAWPELDKVDYSPLDRVAQLLPSGMKVIAGSSGILENTMWLLGYEGTSYLLADDPRLLGDVFNAVGSRLVEHNARQADFESVGAVVIGEDMGHKTQTLLSPGVYRDYLFPWHRRLVDEVHRRGKPIILHSCGRIGAIMDDIIECGWDAKHSFEDQIEPVWKAQERYGDRIALLGGFDMDRISRATADEVRDHSMYLLRTCAPRGGWALGTGNTVANYVPVENFLAMLEVGRALGSYL